MATELDLELIVGESFLHVVRWETSPVVYAPITGITQAAPAVVTSPAHGIPSGWRAAVVSVVGMAQINAVNTPPKASDYTQATVVDVNTVSLNGVNAAGFSAYKNGGYLQYNTPVNLTGYTATMVVMDKIGGTELLGTDSGTITAIIDTVGHTVTFTASAVNTAVIVNASGVYSIEMTSSTGVVTVLHYGTVTFDSSIT